MPPSIALTLWFVLLLWLLRYDPAKDNKPSPALWVPLMWMFIAGSRLPSQWIGVEIGSAVEAYQEGNPLDRTVFFVLILLSIGILISRSLRWSELFERNLALVIFLCFALLSVSWSDFPLVALKRWFRDLGNYLTVLVVLSDPNPLSALKTLLRRLGYLLIPLSIVLVKYYPGIGRNYSEWTGTVAYTGVTTTKDVLGTLCLVSGVFFFWDTVIRWRDRGKRQVKLIILTNCAFIAMTLWLMNLADCMTCGICFTFGCVVIVAAQSRAFRRNPALLKVSIPVIVCLSLFLVFGVDMKASIASAVGRNATFTDRTVLWPYLLTVKINPLLGTGYESFWLGPRLQQIWEKWAFRPNQAHNGYLEVYLNLGVIGVVLVVGFLAASYRTACKALNSEFALASLRLAVWGMLPIYNITTSDFGKGELMWLTFLVLVVVVPRSAQHRARIVRKAGDSGDYSSTSGLRSLNVRVKDVRHLPCTAM